MYTRIHNYYNRLFSKKINSFLANPKMIDVINNYDYILLHRQKIQGSFGGNYK